MNFLAHLYLAGDSEELIIGNFIADAIKGSNYGHLPSNIQKGIQLHRKIDSFTDFHPVVERSKERLRKNYKKYASVIVDIYYDHFLAKNWHHYSATDLEQFTQQIYKLVNQYHSVLPEKSARFAMYMIQYNILYNYSNLKGIERVLQGMAKRASFISNMEHAVHDLQEYYPLFESEFSQFFPELKKYIDEQIILLHHHE